MRPILSHLENRSERICALSGHSKWHNIKLRKGKADAQRGALFTKISKEIILAAKNGSPDVEANYKLKIAVEKARAVNMPVENIKRAIARAQGGSEDNLEEIRYEGYGPAGLAVIVDIATDNRNRSAAEMRFLFNRHGGSLGESGSVAWMFEICGTIVVDPQSRNEEQFTELVLVEGVIDVRYGEPCEVFTKPEDLASVREILVKAKLDIKDAYLGAFAKTTVTPQDAELQRALAFLDALEDHDDVQRVYSNIEVDEEALEAIL